MPDFLLMDILAKPLWMWLIFAIRRSRADSLSTLASCTRTPGRSPVRESLLLSAFYISHGLRLRRLGVVVDLGPKPGLEYLTGFVIEKSLSMDNIFVIAMIFGYFGIPRAYQYRVLFWGILAVIVMRGVHDRASARRWSRSSAGCSGSSRRSS